MCEVTVCCYIGNGSLGFWLQGLQKYHKTFISPLAKVMKKIRIEPCRVHIFGMEPKDKSDGKDNTIIINKFKKIHMPRFFVRLFCSCFIEKYFT